MLNWEAFSLPKECQMTGWLKGLLLAALVCLVAAMLSGCAP